jgi:integrase
VSEAIDAYMKVRAMGCSSDQARRIRSALDMFAELVGDPCLSEITDRTLDEYRDSILPLVPAAENLVRSQFKTSNVRESIRAIEGTSAERISAAEQVKRLKWLAAMFAWLKMKEWISRDPSVALVVESGAAVEVRKAKGRDQDARELFTRADLQQIFSAGPWFRTGRGERTKSGTYREFSPHYYWLPLIALYTGARINELAQLSLSDLCLGSDGLWSIRIAELDDLEEKKKRKNAYSRRLVPVHPKLEDLGLIRWRHALAKRGYRRLFPELKHDAIKGYGKAPTKWFSAYLGRLGWARDGRKTFHSFRSTLVSECVNRLKLTPVETAHISGHARPNDDAISGYIKDQVPAALLLAVQRLDFELPSIAVFDIEAGVDAVADALARKNAGRGGVED